MKRYFPLAAFLITLTLTSVGQNDKEYDKTLKKMFEVSGSEETYKAVIDQMFSMFQQQYANADAEMWNDLKKEITKTSLKDLTKMLTPVYSKYLTQEDLEALIAFYESPAGKKYAKNTPLITQESMQVGQTWGMEIGQKIAEKMQEKDK